VSKPIVDHTKQKLSEKVWDAPANFIWGSFAAGTAYFSNLFSISSNCDKLHERINILEKEKQELEQKNQSLEIENNELRDKKSHWDL
jgi:cell shape-determining protein MreC